MKYHNSFTYFLLDFSFLPLKYKDIAYITVKPVLKKNIFNLKELGQFVIRHQHMSDLKRK